MKVNAKEMNDMIVKTYEPGHEMIRALNMLHDLVDEKELKEDSRYVEATRVLTKCMVDFQTMSFDRGMELCRANAIINKLNESMLGRGLVKKAKIELED